MEAGGIVALITALLGVAGIVLKAIFGKTPEEKERDRVENERKKESEQHQRREAAVQKAESGDTSAIEDILNGG